MKVLLLEDVYNLGRGGEVKKVANGYGRNYLIPQGLATLATPGALTQSDRIREEANSRRSKQNEEMAVVAEQLEGVQLVFPARAGETGKLYGSVTTQMIAAKLSEDLNLEINRRQIHAQPLRLLGMHTAQVRLTIDLIPEISVVVYREGESPENYMVAAEELAAEAEAEFEGQAVDEQPEQPEAGDESNQEESSPESEEN
jgi:large subunit ribosomal protein L9